MDDLAALAAFGWSLLQLGSARLPGRVWPSCRKGLKMLPISLWGPMGMETNE